jgi:hypothetical protein
MQLNESDTEDNETFMVSLNQKQYLIEHRLIEDAFHFLQSQIGQKTLKTSTKIKELNHGINGQEGNSEEITLENTLLELPAVLNLKLASSNHRNF